MWIRFAWLAIFVSSCSSSENESSGARERNCAPGASVACVGPAGCAGAQVCSDDGLRLGACDCGDTVVGASGGSSGNGSGGTTTTGGGAGVSTGGGTGGSLSSSRLGQACTQDGDCVQSGLFCLTQAGDQFIGGGPVGGVCVSDCSQSADQCAEVGAEARCVLVDDGGTVVDETDDVAYCFPGCQIGQFSTTGQTPCGARTRELACVESVNTPGFGVCQPTCEGDVACGSGRECALDLGICVDAGSRSGAPIGNECATDDDCEDFCLDMGGGARVCSGLCTLGTAGCGIDAGSPLSEPLDAYCLLLRSASSSRGDVGFCSPLCDCNDDCAHPDFVCDSFVGSGADFLAEETGRAGACFPAELSDGGMALGMPCNDGGSRQDAGREAGPALDAGGAADASGS